MSLEAEMETEENGEKRKRPLDQEGKEDFAEGNTKRSNVVDMTNSMQVKLLVPSAVAGALIGKNGEAIAALQKETGTKLKMSKSNDFFPCTTERVVLGVGPMAAIKRVLEFIMEKVREKCDPNAKLDVFDCRNVDRSREVKLVIANTTAGMIIGKAGEYIKTIKEQTGAFIQISPSKQQSWVSKTHESSFTERVVTIVGSVDELSSALDMVLAKIAADPNSAMNGNISYAEFTNSSSRCLSPFTPFSASSGSLMPQSFMFGHMGMQKAGPGTAVLGQSAGGCSPSSQLMTGPMSGGLGNLQVLQFLENLQTTLRNSGYSEPAVSDIMQAMQVLTKYNVLGLGLGFGLAAVGNINDGSPSSAVGSAFAATAGMQANSSSGSFYNPNFKSSGDSPHFASGNKQQQFVGRPNFSVSMYGSSKMGYDAPMLDHNDSSLGNGSGRNEVFGLDLDNLASEFRYGERMNLEEDGVNYAASLVKVFSDEKNKLQLEVPENIVGAILGKQGKTLLDIQHFTGAKVEVSKRGNYAPGTQNRIVTLSGTTESIQKARLLAERSINREQMRREMRQRSG